MLDSLNRIFGKTIKQWITVVQSWLYICMVHGCCCLLSEALSRETNVVDMKDCCMIYVPPWSYLDQWWSTITPRLQAELLLVISVLPMVGLLKCSAFLKHDPITKNTALSSLGIKKLITIHSLWSEMQVSTLLLDNSVSSVLGLKTNITGHHQHRAQILIYAFVVYLPMEENILKRA